MTLIGVLGRFDDWFMGPCPPERVAALRVAVGGFGTLYLLFRFLYWCEPLHYQPEMFAPLGVLSLLDAPPGAAVVYGAVSLAIALGACFTLGYLTAWTGPAYAALLLLVMSYRNSWGMLFHVEHLLVLHTLALCFAPVGRAWALDSRRSGRGGLVPAWSVRLLALLTIITYVVAGVAKLRHTGLEWASGDVLREHVAYDALRKIELGGTASPLGPLLVQQAWLFPPLAWLALALELGAPLALLGRRVALAWCLLAWSFHFGVLGMMGILFPYPLLFVAYLPFVPVEEWARRVGQRLRSVSASWRQRA